MPPDWLPRLQVRFSIAGVFRVACLSSVESASGSGRVFRPWATVESASTVLVVVAVVVSTILTASLAAMIAASALAVLGPVSAAIVEVATSTVLVVVAVVVAAILTASMATKIGASPLAVLGPISVVVEVAAALLKLAYPLL